MLTCIPQSLCTWNYRVLGAPSGPAELTFNVFKEVGTISLGGVELEVCKHGWMSGHWSLERNGESYADARKPSAIFRAFEIECGDARSRSSRSRSFRVAFRSCPPARSSAPSGRSIPLPDERRSSAAPRSRNWPNSSRSGYLSSPGVGRQKTTNSRKATNARRRIKYSSIRMRLANAGRRRDFENAGARLKPSSNSGSRIRECEAPAEHGAR